MLVRVRCSLCAQVAWLVLVGVGGLQLSGCAALESLRGEAKPTATLDRMVITGLDLDRLHLAVQTTLHNPYDVALPLTDLAYGLSSDGQRFLSGKADVATTVPPRGSKPVTFPVEVEFAGLMQVLTAVEPGALIPYAADLDLSVDAPAIGTIVLPLRKEGTLPVPTAPGMSLESISWKELTLTSAAAELAVRISNGNQFPVDLRQLDYGLSLAGTPVLRSSVERAAQFAPGGQGTLKVPVTLKPIDLGLSVFRMLTGAGASYELSGTMDLVTPYGALTAPVQGAGDTVFHH